MPRLRTQGLNDLVNIILRDRLASQENRKQEEATRQRQLELAEYTKGQDAAKAESAQKETRLRQYGENPTLAVTASVAGDKDAEKFIQKDQQIMAPVMESIGKAKNAEDLPSMEALWGMRKPGIVTNLNPFNEMANARAAQTQRISDTTSSEVDQAGAEAKIKAFETGMGTEEANALNAPAELARKVTEAKTLDPLKFTQAQKIKNMEAAIELGKQKELYKFQLVEKGLFDDAKAMDTMGTEASKLVLSMTELTSLAFEVNKDYKEGAIDTMAGFRNAAGSLPYLGSSMSQGMATTAAAAQSWMSNDPSLPRKVNQLEGLRRGAAISAIRASGDPRPSDADVSGIIGSIPGAFESLEASAEKSAVFSQAITMLPSIMAAHPGVKGKALLDLAMAEARKSSNTRAITGGTTLKSPNEGAPPVKPPLSPSVQSILGR